MTTTEEITERCESKLEDMLNRGDGKFSMNNITWKIGIVTMGMFDKFLKLKVKQGLLIREKDILGNVYFRKVN